MGLPHALQRLLYVGKCAGQGKLAGRQAHALGGALPGLQRLGVLGAACALGRALGCEQMAHLFSAGQAGDVFQVRTGVQRWIIAGEKGIDAGQQL